MMPLRKVLAAKIATGGLAAATLFAAAPAAAQYYPYGGNGYGYGNGYANGYVANQQAVINQCTAAVQARLASSGGGYAYPQYGFSGGGRVLGISRVEPRNDGGLTVRGVASSSAYGGYNQQPDLTFRCRSDYRGFVTSVDVQRAQSAYGYATPYGGSPYSYGSPYGGSPYGYANPYDSSPDATGPYGYSRY